MDAKMLKELRFLKIYAVVSFMLLMGMIIVGAKLVTKKVAFDEIDVQRINIVEPNGSLRMVISDQTRFPGGIIRGKEYPFDRQTAGMLFFNDEATENGGLIFGGKKGKDGKKFSYGHLSFDAFEQDQVFTIDAGQEGDKKVSGLAIMDRPDWFIGEALEFMEHVKKLPENQQKAEMEKFQAGHPGPNRRLYLGRAEDNSVGIRLLDPQGRERILIQVASDGSPVIKFSDAAGKVVSQWPAK
jgi:hypothetical protein